MDKIGDQAKEWERSAESVLAVDRPILVRMDGRAFSRWTKCCAGSWDVRLHEVFVAVMRVLAQEAGASFAHTHSDEITLVIPPQPQVIFGGRVQKMSSSLAALCTAVFAEEVRKTTLAPRKPATFDARVWNVPDRKAALLSVAWRERDAVKNATATYARDFFSQSQLHGLDTHAMHRLLEGQCHPFGALPAARRHGLNIARVTALRPFSREELEALPAKHAARANPDLVVARKVYDEVPPTKALGASAVDVMFGDEPAAPVPPPA